LGYRVDNKTGNQAILPWTNVNQIVLTYGSPVGAIPTPGMVSLKGNRPGGDYAVTAVEQLDSQIFVLTLDRPLGNVSGGGENGVRVQLTVLGAGPDNSEYSLRLNVLQGDVDRSGSVLATDYSAVKSRFFLSAGAPGYSVFHDVDGSGSILANDFSAVKARFFDTLIVAPQVAFTTFGGTPITKDVLGWLGSVSYSGGGGGVR
jgi:hypothetical protein